MIGIKSPHLQYLVIGLLAVLGGAAIYVRQQDIRVDDARVSTDLVSVGSASQGVVSKIYVKRGDAVKAGDVLLEIDHTIPKLKLAGIEQSMATKRVALDKTKLTRKTSSVAVSLQIQAQETILDARRSDEELCRVEAEHWKDKRANASQLLSDRLISLDGYKDLKLKVDQSEHKCREVGSQAVVEKSRAAGLKNDLARLEVYDLEIAIQERELQELSLERDVLQKMIDDSIIRAPIAGVIDDVFVEEGEFAMIGKRLLMLHDPRKLRIDANIKETDLRYFAVGKPFKFEADAFPGMEFEAVVDFVDSVSQSDYALLPQLTVNGNFTKVTQRFRIEASVNQQGADCPLKPGMMVVLKMAKDAEAPSRGE